MRISDWSSDVCSSDLLLPFRRGDGRKRATLSVDRIPDLLIVADRPALRVLDDPAILVAVQPLAIDAHRGGCHHAPQRTVDQPFEEDGGADVVARGIALDIIP